MKFVCSNLVSFRWLRSWAAAAPLLAVALTLLLAGPARALSINVVQPDGSPIDVEFRWMVEENTTYQVQPGVPDPDTLSVSFHRSYAPVVAEGGPATSATVTLDENKAYFISILPMSGYTIGGGQVKPGQSEVTVVVNPLPLPTAQISVFVFKDDQPINNAPDLPGETGLADFTVLLFEAGGRFGQVGGQVSQDAFGNPLGSTYDSNGNLLGEGGGIITSDADGRALIKYLPPGKYGIQVVPPAGQNWIQTSTIEGTKTIDAWVKANEPEFFTEFGPPGPHVFIGFVQPIGSASGLGGHATITGQVVNLHTSRPPATPFYAGQPFGHTNCWVGLNDLAVGTGRGIYAQPCADQGNFTITGVPAGNYQLVFWDDALDIIFAFKGITITADQSAYELGKVPVFSWFARLENYVFYDHDGDGFRDAGDQGIPNVAVNIRFRDGTIYQSFTTDMEGYVPFDEVFPFFHWLVAEVDNARLEPTGVTVMADAGGDPTEAGRGVLNPQIYDGNPYRIETGPVLTQAFQGFLGGTQILEWGKRLAPDGATGTISGMVTYSTTRAENDPRYAAVEPWEPGIPGVTVKLWRDLDGNGIPEDAEPLHTVQTDSWDDNPPTGCWGEKFSYRGSEKDCFDGLRNFNQVRPGLFDGGYAFDPVPIGTYIVEVVVPTGYQLVKDEDKNVDYGDDYTPVPAALPPACVGAAVVVPDTYSLFPQEGVRPKRAGESHALCDRKQIHVGSRQNAMVDFHLFTYVPIAAHVVGFILDDTANEYDPESPQFGEKYAPPWLPVSFRDWTGREIVRVYSDEFGKYNALLPSTYTVNVPSPSGVSPNMLTACMNDAGPIQDPDNPGQRIIDPHYNRQYSQFCYTFQYMPGTTTYLDTPVVPVAAFAGPDEFPLDCELPDGTPVVNHAFGETSGGAVLHGPYLPDAGGILNIVAQGTVTVPNPAYDGPDGSYPKTITRDYGFGASGTVRLDGQVVPAQWTPDLIRVSVASGLSGGQITVTRDDNGKTSVAAITLTKRPLNRVRVVEPPTAQNQTPIQTAIDLAQPGDTIIVKPGTYEELVVMWKPVQLQGSGLGSTVINAVKAPGEKLAAWRLKVAALVASGDVHLAPGQQGFGSDEGAAVTVLAKNRPPSQGGFGSGDRARIDGFTITGGDHGGGIFVNAYADYLEISNNRVVGNQGYYGGGIRVGHPTVTSEQANGDVSASDANNDNIRIQHNLITQNGGLFGAGGGVALCTGADDYVVASNFICGNFTMGDGGGIGHLGRSANGTIRDNSILFNQTFNQGMSVSGGGIFVGGIAPPAPNDLSDGSGSVTIAANLIQGNQAGAGDGGGIRLSRASGTDVRGSSRNWNRVSIVDNVIVNNVAGLAGAGISLQDTLLADIVHNTIVHNDSTATASEAFAADPNTSTPQPAGVVSRPHSTQLRAAVPNQRAYDPLRDFSNPTMINNIVWHNRSFYFASTADQLSHELVAADEVYSDLSVIGGAPGWVLMSTSSILSTNGPSEAAELFADAYLNGDRSAIILPEVTTIQARPAFDEGGNYIQVRFGPLSPVGDYHLVPDAPAIDSGSNVTAAYPETLEDFDGQPRGGAVDIGADEYHPPATIVAGQ